MKKNTKINRQTARTGGLLQDIHVVSFDMGFTLIYPDPPVGKAYADIAARFGYRLDANETHARFKESWARKTANNRNYKNDNALANEALSYQWWKEIFKEATGDILKPGFFCLSPFFLAPLWPLIMGQWIIKLAIALIDTPIVYLLVRTLRAP